MKIIITFRNITFDEKASKQFTIGAHRFVIYLKDYESGAIYCQKLKLELVYYSKLLTEFLRQLILTLNEIYNFSCAFYIFSSCVHRLNLFFKPVVLNFGKSFHLLKFAQF